MVRIYRIRTRTESMVEEGIFYSSAPSGMCKSTGKPSFHPANFLILEQEQFELSPLDQPDGAFPLPALSTQERVVRQ